MNYSNKNVLIKFLLMILLVSSCFGCKSQDSTIEIQNAKTYIYKINNFIDLEELQGNNIYQTYEEGPNCNCISLTKILNQAKESTKNFDNSSKPNYLFHIQISDSTDYYYYVWENTKDKKYYLKDLNKQNIKEITNDDALLLYDILNSSINSNK